MTVALYVKHSTSADFLIILSETQIGPTIITAAKHALATDNSLTFDKLLGNSCKVSILINICKLNYISQRFDINKCLYVGGYSLDVSIIIAMQ